MQNIPDFVYQILIVLLIPGIIQGVKYFGKDWSDVVKRWVVIGLSIALSVAAGVLYFAPDLPAWSGDPIAFLNALIAVGAPFFLGVEVVYNFILKRVFEGLGWS